MLTGRRAFRGNSAIDTLHSIVHDPPAAIDTVAPEVPAALRFVLDKCLAKDPDERYQSTRDLVVDLKNVSRTLDSSQKLPATAAAASSSTRSYAWMVAAIAVIAVIVLIGVVVMLMTRENTPTTVADATPPKASFERITSLGTVIDATISPDGKYIVYATSENARQGLAIRQLATGSTIDLVPALSGGMWGTSFSPDGNAVYYGLVTPDEPTKAIYRVPILGGTPRKLVSGIDSPPTFSPDGKQMAWLRGDFPNRGESSLMVADVNGQQVRTLVTRRPPEFFVPIFFTNAAWSPDGSRIVVPMWNSDRRTGTLVAHAPSDGGVVPFPKYEWSAIGGAGWLPDGSGLVVVAGSDAERRNNQLWLVRADREARRQITNDFLDYRRATATSDGKTLVTVAAEGSSTIWLTPMDGKGDPARASSSRQDGLNGVGALADGRIAYRSLEGGTPSIWIMKGDGSGHAQVTTEGVASWPAATPDGRWIVYRREGSGLWRVGTDGQGAQPIAGGDGGSQPAITPDGRTIVFSRGVIGVDTGGETLYTLPIDGGTPQPLLGDGATGSRPVVSPDGKQLALYYRDSSAVTTLAVMPIAGGRPTKQFAVAPSTAYAGVRWTADGKGLLHNSALNDRSNIWLQPLDGGESRKVTRFSDQVLFAFDRSADGKMLIIARGTLTRDAVLIKDFR
jgi:Tol biopolymer transport system component